VQTSIHLSITVILFLHRGLKYFLNKSLDLSTGFWRNCSLQHMCHKVKTTYFQPFNKTQAHFNSWKRKMICNTMWELCTYIRNLSSLLFMEGAQDVLQGATGSKHQIYMLLIGSDFADQQTSEERKIWQLICRRVK